MKFHGRVYFKELLIDYIGIGFSYEQPPKKSSGGKIPTVTKPQESASKQSASKPPLTGSVPARGHPPPPASLEQQPSIECSLCHRKVLIDNYTEHLDMYHAQATCQMCGKLCRGVEGLTQHIEAAHNNPVNVGSSKSPSSSYG